MLALLPYLIAAILIVIGIFVIAFFWIRYSGSKHKLEYDPITKKWIYNHTWWAFVPPRCLAGVVGKQNQIEKSDVGGTIERGGGEILDLLHSVPGKVRNKTSDNSYDWSLEDGNEDWGFWQWYTGGAHFLGPKKELMVWAIHELRYVLKTIQVKNEQGEMEDKEVYGTDARHYETLFPYHSSALDVRVNEVNVKDLFTINFHLNLYQERKFPFRALKVDDPNARVSLAAEARVIDSAGDYTPEQILEGKETIKLDIAKSVDAMSSATEVEVGMTTSRAIMYHLDVNAAERAALKLKKDAELKNAVRVQNANTDKKVGIIEEKKKAAIQIIQAETDKKTKVTQARADKKVGILRNDVEADRTERVTLKIAREPNGPAVRAAEAYENNETVVVSGANLLTSLPSELLRPKVISPEEAGVA